MLPPLAISMAISSWRCSPLDIAPAIVSARSARPTTRAHARLAAPPARDRPSRSRSTAGAAACAASRQFSATVKSRKMLVRWYERPIPRRAMRCAGQPATSSPSTRMRRPTAGSAPDSRLVKVVLPAPFGPMIACTMIGRERSRHAIDARQAAEGSCADPASPARLRLSRRACGRIGGRERGACSGRFRFRRTDRRGRRARAARRRPASRRCRAASDRRPSNRRGWRSSAFPPARHRRARRGSGRTTCRRRRARPS